MGSWWKEKAPLFITERDGILTQGLIPWDLVGLTDAPPSPLSTESGRDLAVRELFFVWALTEVG